MKWRILVAFALRCLAFWALLSAGTLVGSGRIGDWNVLPFEIAAGAMAGVILGISDSLRRDRP